MSDIWSDPLYLAEYDRAVDRELEQREWERDDTRIMPRHRKGGRYCKRGHEYTPENTHINLRGVRECRACGRLAKTAYKQRNVERVREAERLRRGRPATVTCPDCGESRTLTFGAAKSAKRCFDCAKSRLAERMRTGAVLTCPVCGGEFYRKAAYLAKRGLARTLYCSIACRKLGGGYTETARELSLARGGPGNPAYKHGRRVHVAIPGWKLSRKGESKCRNCGSRDRVQLHHAIPRVRSEVAKADLRNGIPLCWDCHHGWHSKRVTIYRDVFTPDEWDFLCSVELVDRNIDWWLDKHYPPRRAA